MTTGEAVAAATSLKVGVTFSNRLRHMESMSLHPSGVGRISHLNVVILGEPLESEENDLIFPSQEFSSQLLIWNQRRCSRKLISDMIDFCLVHFHIWLSGDRHIFYHFSEYMLEKLGVEENNLLKLCTVLYKHYGTIMAGLKAIGYNFDYDDFHSFFHGRLPYETLKPDPVISQLLLSLPVRKVIFTNGDQAHAAKVLKKLDLEDCFDIVICFETLNPSSSSSREDNSANIFDIIGYLSKPDPNVDLPKTPIAAECYGLVNVYSPLPPLTSLPPTGSKLPIIVYIHNGGFIIFHVASSPFHGLCSRLAAALPAVVLSVDYHLSSGTACPLPLRMPSTPSSGSGPTPWGRLRRETSPSCSPNAPTSQRCFLMVDSAGATIAFHASLRVAAIQDSLAPLSITGLKIVNGGRVNSWTCINFAKNVQDNLARGFCHDLAQMCQISGMEFSLHPVLHPLTARRDHVERVLSACYHDAMTILQPQGKELDLLIVILPNNDGSLYVITSDQKQICETGLCLVSQCCLTKHVFRMSKQYLANVGGRGAVLVDALSRRIPLVSDRPTIIFGADVTHPHPGEDSNPSITVVVSSQDLLEVTKYAGLVCA
ncbi:hypothetical protein ZIOFF_063111 [Zingiber officinale]|uniref:Piwi domain-containing protein n=1 Tax=Zingiber officinale TaxID=94328 RepID=A0A8J5F1S5_ZINOF|nr:hypothetical protein ZIOFF_063111 [Zingiber officinale]